MTDTPRRITFPVHVDSRGNFTELWSDRDLALRLGFAPTFAQDNLSESTQGVVRGLHYQAFPHGQAKLIRPVLGRIWDVVVDLRRSSPSFLAWEAFELDAARGDALWVPEGFAHGFAVLSPMALVYYKASRVRVPEAERRILWNDPALAIPWPIESPILSDADRTAPRLAASDHQP